MDTVKLNKWAELLLDTGKRNNLINFKDSSTYTAEVLLPDSGALFEKIDGAASLEVFDPKIAEEDEQQPAPEEPRLSLDDDDEPSAGDGLADGQAAEKDAKQQYIEKYSPKIKKPNRLLLYAGGKNPLTALKNIDKKAREYIDETGVNVAYMAFGFINWREDSSDVVYRAPVLLAPVTLERKSAVDPYYIHSAEDDIILNPTFAYKLEAEHGVKMPEYTDDEPLADYLARVSDVVKKLGWSVTGECKIGIFSFQKINMYRDLKDNQQLILKNKNVRLLLGEPWEEGDIAVKTDSDPLIQLHSVVDADSSQMEAIEMAKSGQSFVLQGPPGTGKSQTITNIIAEMLSAGKKVLFVSEKLAALNVVYDKLKKNGLAEFCLQLHSHKANKKEVIADLCHTLRAEKHGVAGKAQEEINAKIKAKDKLDNYAKELHAPRAVVDTSLYKLYEAYAKYKGAPDIAADIPDIQYKGNAYLTDTAALLEQYAEYAPAIGYDYKNNPWYGYINKDVSYQAKVQVEQDLKAAAGMLKALAPLSAEISEKYGVNINCVGDARIWRNFFHGAAGSRLITPALLNRDNFERTQAALQDLKTKSAQISQSKAELLEEYDDDILKLNGDEQYKKLTRQLNGGFSRLFSGEYKQLIKDLRLYSKKGQKLSYEQACALMQKIAGYQKVSAEFSAAEAPVKPLLGEAYKGTGTDWDYIDNQIETLNSFFNDGINLGSIASLTDFSAQKASFEEYSDRLGAALSSCDEAALKRIPGYFDYRVLNIYGDGTESALNKINGCINNMDGIDNYVHFRDIISQLETRGLDAFIQSAIKGGAAPEMLAPAFKKRFYFQWIASVLSASPVLSGFSRINHDHAIGVFRQKDVEQFTINKAVIRSELGQKRPSLDMVAQGSSLAKLLREGEKKRRQMPIRKLLTQTGDLVQAIKPCFLMSPLSVSTFLEPGEIEFDAVVFDEASQIFPQDAIGAVYRGKQLIVVGDSKQMPPSDFFNSSVDTQDSDDADEGVTDYESILDLCSTAMRQLRLKWHYRSKHEELIAFSNKNYYDGELVTFPSPAPDAPGIGVDYCHVDGIFDRKSHSNRKEAEYVVDLIYRNIEQFPGRSLGVVAFSVSQQKLIDSLLSKRRQNEPDKEFFFKTDTEEPFFIKNLETVQGDERDTIIFSTAYGYDSAGKMLHNFGPLNRVGGERRLNVAVTRAKSNVQLVSSMRHTDIDLSRTSAEGARLLKEYIEFAQNGGAVSCGAPEGGTYGAADADFELGIAEFLRKNGYDADTRIGCSGFKIDVGLKRPDTGGYAMAIECDGEAYKTAKNTRDRDRLRTEVLERMGWKHYRLWSTDWFKNSAYEQKRLLEAAEAALKGADKRPDNAVNNAAAQQVSAQQTAVTQNAAAKAPGETYEETAQNTPSPFKPYEYADADAIMDVHKNDYKTIVYNILKTEAPLSEDALLKRTVGYFNRQKVTATVKKDYEAAIEGIEKLGVAKNNGFLYLVGEPITFRTPAGEPRPVKQIAPEELAAGMYELIRQNVTVEKAGLYQTMAELCGFSHSSKPMTEVFDDALKVLDGKVEVEDGEIKMGG